MNESKLRSIFLDLSPNAILMTILGYLIFQLSLVLNSDITERSFQDLFTMLLGGVQVADSKPATSYLVALDANGGTCSTISLTTDANGMLSTLPTPTMNLYSFSGWFTAPSGGSQVTTDTVFNQDTTIYAHWQKNSTGGGSGDYPSVSYYSVQVSKSKHGIITASPISIYSEGTVTLTVVPEDGYKLDMITVTDGQGKVVEIVEKSGKYIFKMPSQDVVVKATFVLTQIATATPKPSSLPTPTESPAPTMSPFPEPWKNPFPDVSNMGWYIKAIEFVCTQRLMSGYGNGKFGPNDNLTRAQFAQILYYKEGKPDTGNSRFSDVKPGQWYTKSVNWAASQSTVYGYGNGEFGPNDPITRQDLAVMLWRYDGSPEPTRDELDFTDVGKASKYAWTALCWANETGIINGKPGKKLDTKGWATRAEAAQMLKNYLSKHPK